MHFAVLSDPNHFHTQKWVKGLLEAGQEVSVFSFEKGEIEGANCVRINPRFSRKGQATYLSFLFSGKALLKALQEHQIDILNPINMTPYGVWGRNAHFTPMVSIAMGADILEYPPKDLDLLPESRRWEKQTTEVYGPLQGFISRLKRRFFRGQVQKALDASSLITGDNLLLVHAVREWFGIAEKKVHLNRWGIEEELFKMSAVEEKGLKEKFGIADGQRVVLSPRGLKPIYQGDIIIAAFEKLLKAGRKEKYILLSAGYEIPQEVDEKAQRLSQAYPNFHYVRGLIPREEACKLWNLTDVFISAPIYDGYSNALSEGRFMGAVPIVNDIPATQELLVHKKNGWIVDPFEPQKLAEELEIVLEDVDEWKETFSAKNREWILANAHLKSNMKAFVEACEKLL